MTRPANNKETEENQGKETDNSPEWNGWTAKPAIVKEAEDMEEARTQGEDEW